MSKVQDLITMLQSSDPDKRYDACDEMKSLASLPAEALEALRTASRDEDRAVAEIAQEAIKIHAKALRLKENQEKIIVEEKEAAQLPFSPGAVSTAIGVLLAISLFVLINLPLYFSGPGENPLRDPRVARIGSWALFGILLVGLISILGIVIGRKGIRISPTSRRLGLAERAWSWLGIIINILVLLATPFFWLLLVAALATA